MALASFDYINPADAVGLSLTPERTNYLDTYDFTTYDIPHLRAAAIEKYAQNIDGFIAKFSATEQLTSDKYIWSELESKAVTYDDAVLTIGADNVLTRAAGADLHYRLHEKVQIHSTDGAGVFIVEEVTSATSIKLGTYDAGSLAVLAAYTAPLTSVYAYSLGIEVGKGSLGADFTEGVKRNYTILSNRPTITREVYSELGSVTPQIKWVNINGQYKWFITEIDDTRDRFLEAIEKKHIEGTIPAATTDALASGLQGTQGLFSAVESRGATWNGSVGSVSDLESIIKHLNKVQGAGVNLFLCDQDQEFAFDTLGRTFNASYGAAVLDNHIGDYNNSENGKILDLGFKGFQHGGYTFLKQGWKYLKENTFRGNGQIAAADKVSFLSVPVGMTPVSFGDQNLDFNSVKTQMNYLTKMSLRDYDTWTEGGAWVNPRTNGDDKFKVHFLNESMLAVYNAEKFIIGKGA